MATYVDQAYYGWAHDDVTHQDDSQEISASQMLDHGSISFGRFAYESLSWERRSVFTHNKCQEELEKFKCPGLVAKKKAYFEEYYKRIRAMKDSQENQQPELTLDYGGDESISSQNGEEDGTTVHLGNHGEGTANIVDGHPEETAVKISAEKEIPEVQNSNSDLEQENHAKCPPGLKDASAEMSARKVKEIIEIPNRHSDPETTTRNLDSLRCNSEDLGQEDYNVNRLQMQQLDTEHQDLISPMKIVEVTEHLDISNLDNEEDVSRETPKTHIEPERDPKATKLNPSNSKLGDLELKPVKTMVPEKVMPRVRSHKGHVLVHKEKEPSATGRNGSKPEDKTKPNVVKPSPGPKYASQRTPKKSGNLACSSKTSADEVLRSYNSPYTPTQGPSKSDNKPSNNRISLAVHKKDAVNVQVNSKKTTMTVGVQSQGFENKRGYEERKKHLPLDRQRISLKDRGANVPEPPKARSVNLPARTTTTSSIVTDNRTKVDVRAHRQKENKSEARSREVCRTGRNVAVPPARNARCETTKVISSWTGNRSINGKKLRFGEQSLDGKKLRQEKPRWR